ncbi:hypothetical protein Mgra_00003818, partial [Meloidogyne graminicola]
NEQQILKLEQLIILFQQTVVQQFEKIENLTSKNAEAINEGNKLIIKNSTIDGESSNDKSEI